MGRRPGALGALQVCVNRYVSGNRTIRIRIRGIMEGRAADVEVFATLCRFVEPRARERASLRYKKKKITSARSRYVKII